VVPVMLACSFVTRARQCFIRRSAAAFYRVNDAAGIAAEALHLPAAMPTPARLFSTTPMSTYVIHEAQCVAAGEASVRERTCAQQAMRARR